MVTEVGPAASLDRRLGSPKVTPEGGGAGMVMGWSTKAVGEEGRKN